jgi:hypothetical protein
VEALQLDALALVWGLGFRVWGLGFRGDAGRDSTLHFRFSLNFVAGHMVILYAFGLSLSLSLSLCVCVCVGVFVYVCLEKTLFRVWVFWGSAG